IHYEYEVEGEKTARRGVARISHRGISGQSYFETLRPFLGNSARIRYLPNDPGFHSVEHLLPERIGSARLDSALYLAFAGLLGLVGLTLVGAGVLRRRRGRRR